MIRILLPAMLALLGAGSVAQAADKALQSEFDAICLQTGTDLPKAQAAALALGYVETDRPAELGPTSKAFLRDGEGVSFFVVLYDMALPGEAGRPAQRAIACNVSRADSKTGASETFTHMRSQPQP